MVACVVNAARSVMVLGTASHVGKSLIAAALCRIFSDDGYAVAPFKAQNMSLNSAATPTGGEIGRAQALQAECARVAPSVDMNPVLLKPSSDTSSQVVVLGEIAGESDARTYHRERVTTLFPIVVAAYERLAQTCDLVVLEGAGSPAEINLKALDIVNLRMARAANAPCMLVADIDRGGMFAALFGTLALLEPNEREQIRGFVVNKFRGDRALLQPGIEEIEQRIGIPCFGVIPYLHELGLDEEDGVSLEDERRRAQWRDGGSTDPERALRVAVIALPHLANFTDFDALASEESVDLIYAREPRMLDAADVVIIPGTKRTIDDLDWLRETGFECALEPHLARGLVVGICGGFQMLGQSIDDPHGVEGGGTRAGLGALSICTTLHRIKTTRTVHGQYVASALFGQSFAPCELDGYEIHVGETTYLDDARSVIAYEFGKDGASTRNGSVMGTYVHGVFGADDFRARAIDAARRTRGLRATSAYTPWRAEREARIDRWAAHVRGQLDLRAIRAIVFA